MINLVIQVFTVWIKTHYIYLLEDHRLRSFLDKLIETLDMTVIIPTMGVKVPIDGKYCDEHGKKLKDGDLGYSYLVGIAQSHIALHTWPKYEKAFLTIVSCKKFEEKVVESVIESFFNPCSCETQCEMSEDSQNFSVLGGGCE